MNLMIDTLKLSSRLVESGMDRKQAEILSFSISDAVRESDVATKKDFEFFRSEIKQDIDAFKSEMRQNFENSRAETKAEFEKVRAETKAEFEKVRGETKTEFEKMRFEAEKHRLEVRADIVASRNQTMGFMLAVTGLALAAAKFLF